MSNTEPNDLLSDENSSPKTSDLLSDENSTAVEVEVDDDKNKIHSRMWEGSSWLDASAQFKEWKNKAKSDNPEGWSTSLLGGLRYTDPKTGKTEGVPVPEQSALDNFKDVFGASFGPTAKAYGLSETDNFGRERGSGDATVSTGSNLLYGIRESMGDAAVLGGAVVDKIGEETGAYDTDATEYLEGKVVQTDTSESLVDSLVSDGGPALLAALIPAKMAYTAVTKAPMLIRGLAAEVAAAFGGAMTLGTEEGTLAVGQNSAMGLFDGLDLDDEASSNAIETRINAFAEGLALSGIVGTAAVTAKTVGKGAYNIFLKGLVDMMRPKTSGRFFEGLDKAVFDDLMVRLGQLPPTASPEEIIAKNNEIAEVIRQNKDVIIKMLDTSGSDKTLTLDTITAFIKGSEEGADMSSLLGYRRGVELNNTAGGAGDLSTAVAGPSNAVDEALVSQRKEIVGNSGVDKSLSPELAQEQVLKESSDKIVGEGQKLVDNVNIDLKTTEAELTAKMNEIIPTDPNDLQFIDAVTRLEKISGLEIGTPKTESVEKIKAGLENAYVKLSTEKNRLYGLIEGGDVDPKGMVDILNELKPAQLDNAAQGLPKSSPLGVLLESLQSIQRKAAKDVAALVKEGTIDEAQAAGAIEDMITEGMEGFLTSQGMTFSKLYTEIRPTASRMAEALYDSGTPLGEGGGAVLREFVKYIDNEALDFAADNDAAIKPLALAAKEYYANTFTPAFRGGGVLERFGQLYQRTIGRSNPDDLLAPKVKAQGFGEESQTMIVDEVLNGGNPDKIKNLVDTLRANDTGEAGAALGRQEAVLDYMIFDVVNKFADSVRSGGMQAADFSTFSTQLQGYSEAIIKAFPEKTAVIQQLVKNLDSAGTSQAQLLELMEKAGKVAKVQKAAVQKTVIGKFIDNNGSELSFLMGDDTFKATGNPRDAFKAVFKSNNSMNDIERLIEVAEATASAPEKKIILDGLKLAFNEHATAIVQTSGKNLQNITEISVANINNAQAGNTNLYGLARKIYGNDSDFTGAFEQVLDLAKVTAQGQRAKPVAGESSTAFNRAAMSATQTSINVMLGPLTRLGTQIRTLAGGVIDKMAPDRAANRILVNLLADPNYFLELAAKFNKVPNDPLLQEMLERYVMVGVVRGASLEDESGSGADAQTQAILTTISNQAARFAKP